MKLKRILSLVLTGLILFGTGMPSKAKAETRPMNIKSIFNMTEEQSEKTIELKDIIRVYVEIYGKNLAIPVIEKEIRIEDDDSQYTTEDWIIKQSKFNEIFYNAKFPNGFDAGRTFLLLKELSSGDILAIDDFFSKEVIVNENFFKGVDNDRYETDGNGVLRIYGFSSFINAFRLTNPKAKLDIEKKYTFAEFKELYEKVFARRDWPVEEILKKNTNLTMPKFGDDFLISTELVDNDYLLLLSFIDKKSKQIQKILLLYLNKEDMSYHDLLTGENVMEIPTKKLNTKYLNSIGVKSKEYDIFRIDHDITFVTVVNNNDNERGYMLLEMGVKFQTVKTIADALEIYSYLPEGFEPDYSHFDFSNSPNVDPIWLASRPVPTPEPYAELTIGSNGQEVLDMKQRFYELGYYRTTSFNDRFTDKTAETVELFEKNNSLPVDGVADAVMLGVLFSDRAVGK